MPDRHNDAVFGAGADLELRGEVLLGDRQGVVAAGEETIGELFEQALSIVEDPGGFAVTRLDPDDQSIAGGGDRLVTETDAEDGNFRAQLAYGLDADAGACRSAGAGRENESVRRPLADPSGRDGIVANDLTVVAQLLEVAGEVVDEAVEIVDE